MAVLLSEAVGCPEVSGYNIERLNQVNLNSHDRKSVPVAFERLVPHRFRTELVADHDGHSCAGGSGVCPCDAAGLRVHFEAQVSGPPGGGVALLQVSQPGFLQQENVWRLKLGLLRPPFTEDLR